MTTVQTTAMAVRKRAAALRDLSLVQTGRLPAEQWKLQWDEGMKLRRGRKPKGMPSPTRGSL